MIRKKLNSGFTLLEILVVLVIIGLVISLVPPLLSNAMASTKVKSVSRELAVKLKQARSQSVEKQQETTLILDVNDKFYKMEKLKRHLDMPDDASLKLVTAKSEQLTDSSGQIRFFPDGSSTGGLIKLSYRQQDTIVDVNWLTGKVKIIP